MKRGATYKPKQFVEIINLDDEDERISGYKFGGKLYDLRHNLLPANYVQVKNWSWVLLVCGAASLYFFYKIFS